MRVAHTDIIRAFSAREARGLELHRCPIGTCSSSRPVTPRLGNELSGLIRAVEQEAMETRDAVDSAALAITRRIALRIATMGATRYNAASPAVWPELNSATTSGCCCSTSQNSILPVVRATPSIRVRKLAGIALALTGAQIVISVRQRVKFLRQEFQVTIVGSDSQRTSQTVVRGPRADNDISGDLKRCCFG